MQEQEIMHAVWQGVRELLSKANPAFMALNIIWILLLRMAGEKSFKKAKPGKFGLLLRTVPNAYYVILQSIVLAIIWAYFFRYTTREQTAELFFSITFSMIVWKLGIEKLVKTFQKK